MSTNNNINAGVSSGVFLNVITQHPVLLSPNEDAVTVVPDSVIGYDNKRGIVDLATDITTVLRNRKFNDYLSKPLDIEISEYVTTPYDENAFLLVASLKLEATRLFISTEQ